MLELDQMHEELRSHPVVLQARYDIHAKAGQWNEAAEIATRLLELSPANCGAWTGLSYATRRKQGGGIPQAKEILLKAAARFPKEPLIAYNLACYECQLGNLDQARQWLKKAGELGSPAVIKKMAASDPDLKPLMIG